MRCAGCKPPDVGRDDRRKPQGTPYGTAVALSRFLVQESGHIVNLGSVAGLKMFAPGGTVYSGTKFAVRTISEGLRREVGEHVRATTVEPYISLGGL
jgi:NADP-dependent 3-hydroxy acid dehydrogenase YdfG